MFLEHVSAVASEPVRPFVTLFVTPRDHSMHSIPAIFRVYKYGTAGLCSLLSFAFFVSSLQLLIAAWV